MEPASEIKQVAIHLPPPPGFIVARYDKRPVRLKDHPRQAFQRRRRLFPSDGE